MGRFEEALVFYHQGVKQRPDMDLFHQGVRKAQEAIEISLGGTPHFVNNKSIKPSNPHYDINNWLVTVKQPTLQQQQQYRTTTSRKTWPLAPSSRFPPFNGHQPMNKLSNQLQQRLWPDGPTSHRETSLLGDLHVDKIYLERLLENPGKKKVLKKTAATVI